MASLNVRPMTPRDIAPIVRYFTEAPPDLLARMGIAPENVPSAKDLTEQLETLLKTPDSEAQVCYTVWNVDGKSIGFSSLKHIQFGETGDMHLHIWDESIRGKGLGGVLFSLSALHFYERFRLKKIVCEPRQTNPLPNRMLEKAGFPLVGKRFGKSSELSIETDLNTYEIRRDIAQDCIVLNLGQLQLD
jgi:RimJ/RimL family protein N-acetyltransferase